MAPLNDLERLLTKRKFGPQDYPELFRLLRETAIVFLLPHHPEMEGATIAVKNGDELPPFVIWSDPEGGERIPVFSSIERAQEACQRTSTSERQYILCDMPGQQLFELLSCQPHPIAINPATNFPSLMMDIEGVKQLAHRGPESPAGHGETSDVQLLTAAEYPTQLVQALFQYLRDCAGTRAAWLAKDPSRTQPGTAYTVLLLETGDQEKIRNGLNIVAGSAITQEDSLHAFFLDATNADALAVVEKFTPFYAAPDYKAASPLGPD